MTDDRTFSDEEIARIFEEAAKETQEDDREGLTLSDLKEIGAASGLSAAAVERAASRLNQVVQPSTEKKMGEVIGTIRMNPRKKTVFNELGVSGNVELPRHLSEAEWAELVAEIRTTFDAKGKVKALNPREEWYDKGISVVRERSPLKDRLRLSSSNRARKLFIRFGLAMAGWGTLLFFIGLGAGGEAAPIGLMILFASALSIYLSRRSSRKWAKHREDQLERISKKALDLASGEKIDLLSGLNYSTEEKLRVVRVEERSN